MIASCLGLDLFKTNATHFYYLFKHLFFFLRKLHDIYISTFFIPFLSSLSERQNDRKNEYPSAAIEQLTATLHSHQTNRIRHFQRPSLPSDNLLSPVISIFY